MKKIIKRKRNSILFIVVYTVTFLFVHASVAQVASSLKIGVAKVKITPEEPTILGGYNHGSASLCNPASDILDDIFCRILVAEDGSGNREVFLSMDVCVYMEKDYYDPHNGVGVWWPRTVPSGTTQRFADAGSVGLNKVFVSATHTHQASEQLAEKYIQRIIDGINTAKSNMVFVNLGYTNTTYDINVNRRPDFGVHPELECDKSLVVAIFRNTSDNSPVASIVNYAIHNTGIGVGGNGYNKCSTELTGIAMNKIESNYGGGFVSLFFQGFEGDIGPNCDGRNGEVYSSVVTIGNTFGQDCFNVLNGISASSNPVSVNGTTSSQSLATKPGWGVTSQEVNFAAASIGDICFIGGSGELFNQMGISLRLQSPFGAVVTAALINGYSGYVPTLSGFFDGVGGPEVTTKSPWTSSIENTYMTEMSKLVSSLTGGTSKLGYSSVGSYSQISVANNLIVSKYNAGANMTLNGLKIYVQNATGTVRMGLYADNGRDSLTLLQQTGEIALANGWNEGAMSPTTIGPGTYWIGFVFSDGGNIIHYEPRKLGSYSQSYPFGILPSNPRGMNWGGEIYSVYAGNVGNIVSLTGISVGPTSASISVNSTQKLTATISPSNAANKSIVWSSDNISVATISSNGLVTGLAAGSATITATTQDGGKTATSIITVTSSTIVTGITVSPTLAGISVGGTQQLTAAIAPSNATNTNVSWSSDNTSVATVNSLGLVTGVAVGSATITVTTQDGGKKATSVITVDSGNGTTLGLNSVGSITESQDNGFWIACSFTAVSNITINRMNIYVSQASGNARLGIYSSSSTEPGTLLAQTAEISLSNGWNNGTLGASQNLISGVTYWLAFEVNSSATTMYYNTASDRLRYKSFSYGSLPSSAPLNCTSGTGIYSIYADYSSTSMVTGITVSPTLAGIFVGGTQQLTAGIAPSNATNTNVSWSSDNTSVAKVNSLGLVTGVAAGSANITVTTQDGGKTATSVITVNSGNWIASSYTAVSNITINRMNIYISQASGNARLGIYSNSSGEPGALLAQTGEISLSNGWNSGTFGSSQNLISGVTYWLAFEVNSSATTMYYNTASGRLRYKSFAYGPLPSPAPLNSISGTGIYSIYADNSGGSGTTLVTGVSISPILAGIFVGASQQLTAAISPSNASNTSVSWSSDNTSVATVNSLGLLTGVAAGSTNITVTTQDGGKTATSVITVDNGNVTTLGLNSVGSIAENMDNGFWIASSFTAVSNITINRMNIYVSQASGNARLGIYSNSSGEPSALLAQTGEISLSNGWNSGTFGSAQNLISGVTYWLAFEVNSSATTMYYNTASGRLRYKSFAYGPLPSSAPLNSTSGTGIYSIYADNSGGSGTTLVTGISISPILAGIFVGASQQLTAAISPSNATNTSVSWSSDNTSVAIVNSLGLVTGVAAGSANITVTTLDGGKTATSVITVDNGNGTTLGLNSVGSIAENMDNGFWIASSFTAVSNITINRMNIYVSQASGNARLGIYSNSSGEPGALIAQTGEISLSNGWNSGTFGSSQNLISGVTYWLAFEVNSSATTMYYNTASGRLRYKSFAYGPLPSSAPLNSTSGTGIYSIYADNSGGSGTTLVTGISVNPTSASLSVNATQQLTALVSPFDATNKTILWSSDNIPVATVNSLGLVTGVAAGSVNITATTQDGGKTATSVITVTGSGSIIGLNTVGGATLSGTNGLKNISINGNTLKSNTVTTNKNQFMVFPNPNSNGMLYANLISITESAIINIHDLTGHLIYTKSFVNSGDKIQIDISALNSGIYFINIMQGNLIFHSKLIIK